MKLEDLLEQLDALCLCSDDVQCEPCIYCEAHGQITVQMRTIALLSDRLKGEHAHNGNPGAQHD